MDGHDIQIDPTVAEIREVQSPSEQDVAWTSPNPVNRTESLTPDRRQQKKVDQATVTRDEETKGR